MEKSVLIEDFQHCLPFFAVVTTATKNKHVHLLRLRICVCERFSRSLSLSTHPNTTQPTFARAPIATMRPNAREHRDREKWDFCGLLDEKLADERVEERNVHDTFGVLSSIHRFCVLFFFTFTFSFNVACVSAPFSHRVQSSILLYEYFTTLQLSVSFDTIYTCCSCNARRRPREKKNMK